VTHRWRNWRGLARALLSSVAAALPLATAQPQGPAGRAFSLDDLARIHTVTDPAISPDGNSIAYFFTDEQANNQPKLALIPFAGGEPSKTIDLPRSVQPIAFAWMPDGRSVAYLDNASGILNVWSQPLDGSSPKQLTNFKSEFLTSFAISRDGTIAAYRWSATRDIVLIKDYR